MIPKGRPFIAEVGIGERKTWQLPVGHWVSPSKVDINLWVVSTKTMATVGVTEAPTAGNWLANRAICQPIGGQEIH